MFIETKAFVGSWAGRQPLEFGELGDGIRIRGLARGNPLDHRSRSPHLHALLHFLLDHRNIAEASKTAKQNEMGHALRVGGREHHAHGRAFGESKKGCALRTDLVHHGANVIHPLL
jgi:hypothetical protein